MAEGGGFLDRCTVKSCTGGSNPPLSASKSIDPRKYFRLFVHKTFRELCLSQSSQILSPQLIVVLGLIFRQLVWRDDPIDFEPLLFEKK